MWKNELDGFERLKVSLFFYSSSFKPEGKSTVTPMPVVLFGTSSPQLSCSCGRLEPRKSKFTASLTEDTQRM